VIAPVHAGSGRTDVKLCLSDGSASRRLVTRRDGDLFRRLRRADWGDAIDP
jgi:Predicted rRNA methylase